MKKFLSVNFVQTKSKGKLTKKHNSIKQQLVYLKVIENTTIYPVFRQKNIISRKIYNIFGYLTVKEIILQQYLIIQQTWQDY